MTNIDNAKVIDRIRKLLELSKSANEHEAAAAAARASQLMHDHEIGEAMLRVTDSSAQAEEIIEGKLDAERQSGKRVAWKILIASGAAHALGLSKVWTSGGTMLALGRTTAVQTWNYVCQYLYNEIDRLVDEAWDGPVGHVARARSSYTITARAWKNAFRYGAASTVTARLIAQAEQQAAGRKAEIKARAQLASGGVEATGATMALAVIERDHAEVAAKYEERAKYFSKGTTIGATSSADGYHAGRRAGESVNINTGGKPGLRAPSKAIRS